LLCYEAREVLGRSRGNQLRDTGSDFRMQGRGLMQSDVS
jgi:hypothetical protein